MTFNLEISLTAWIMIGCLALFTLLLASAYRWWIRLPLRHRATLQASAIDIDDTALQPLSVIVYARDNSSRLARLLPDILAQEYPAGFEVIVVNDGGGDAVSDVVTRLALTHPNLRLTFVPDNAHNLSRKKLAITLGVKAARHPNVIITAAECELPGNRWLRSMGRHFAAGREVVLGHSVISGDDDTQRTPLSRLDEAALAVAWMSSALRRHPYRGNGYNIGYSRELFFSHKGFSRTLNLHEGDDDLFINEITDRYNTALELSSDSIVRVRTSRPEKLFSELKTRHCFTGRMLPRTPRRVTTAATITLWLSIFIAIAASIIAYPNMAVAAASIFLLILQWVVTSLSWHSAARAVGIDVSAWNIVPAMLRMPFYNLRYSITSRRETYRNYTWHHKKKI